MNMSYGKLKNIREANTRLEKSFIREETSSSFCSNPNSPQAMAEIERGAKNIADNLKELQLTKEDIDMLSSSETIPENYKKELVDLSTPIVQNLDVRGLKNLIKKVKETIKNKKNIQEQDLSTMFQPVLDWFAKVPPQLLWIVGIWYIARLCRCVIYKLESKLFNCGLEWKTSVLGRVTQFLLLDFKNLFDSDPTYTVCGPIGGHEEY